MSDQVSSAVASSEEHDASSQIDRFKMRWTNLPRRDAPRAGPDAYVELKHHKSLVRQEKLERERRAFTAKRRSMIDELDWLFRLSEDPRAHFMRLHERATGQGVCASIVLRYAFAVHLDRVRAEHRRNRGRAADLGTAGYDVLTQARLALRRAEPEVSRVVEATSFRRPSVSERILAHEMGVHHRTIGRWKWRGFRLMREWIEDRYPPPDDADDDGE